MSDTTSRWENRIRSWFVRSGTTTRRQPEPQEEPWEQAVDSMREFVGAILRQPIRPEVLAERRERIAPRLPFDLYLALASRSQKVYSGGIYDPFTCFERCEVSASHDVEFLTRLEFADRGSENYQAFGVVRLYRGGDPLPSLERAPGLWESLRQDYGLTQIPPASWLLQSSPIPTRRGAPRAFVRRVVAPRTPKVFARVGMRRYFYGDVLEILRERLTDRQIIAWMEQAFRAPLRPGEIRHRYYLTRRQQVVVIRQHWRKGKRLFVAETSDEARRICAGSGAFQRLRLAA